MSEAPIFSASDLDRPESYRGLPLVAMPLWKLAVLSLATVSFYHLIWFYRQWRRQRSVEDCSPFWRAVLGVFFFPALAMRVRDRRQAEGLSAGFSTVALAITYLAFQIVWRLPDPWFIVGVLSFLPLLPVQHSINELNRHLAVPQERPLNIGTIVALLICALLWLLVLVGLFLPAS